MIWYLSWKGVPIAWYTFVSNTTLSQIFAPINFYTLCCLCLRSWYSLFEKKVAVKVFLESLKDSYLNNYFDFHVCLSFLRPPFVRPSVRPSVCPITNSSFCSWMTKCCQQKFRGKSQEWKICILGHPQTPVPWGPWGKVKLSYVNYVKVLGEKYGTLSKIGH